jgi:hypothetical protein
VGQNHGQKKVALTADARVAPAASDDHATQAGTIRNDQCRKISIPQSRPSFQESLMMLLLDLLRVHFGLTQEIRYRHQRAQSAPNFAKNTEVVAVSGDKAATLELTAARSTVMLRGKTPQRGKMPRYPLPCPVEPEGQ